MVLTHTRDGRPSGSTRAAWGRGLLGLVWVGPAFLIGCTMPQLTEAPPQRGVDPQSHLRMNLALKVNGLAFNGVAVLKRAASYKIEGKSPGNFDLLTLSSCHREVVLEDEGSDFSYEYKPDELYEAINCSLLLEGDDKGKGRHTLGLVDFEDPDFTLTADLHCNGVRSSSRGVGICQSRAGLVQGVSFQEKVEVDPDPKCAEIIDQGEGQYDLPLPLGKCVYVFKGTSSGALFRLTSYGYDSIALEKD